MNNKIYAHKDSSSIIFSIATTSFSSCLIFSIHFLMESTKSWAWFIEICQPSPNLLQHFCTIISANDNLTEESKCCSQLLILSFSLSHSEKKLLLALFREIISVVASFSSISNMVIESNQESLGRRLFFHRVKPQNVINSLINFENFS